jgi:hypothetical protein
MSAKIIQSMFSDHSGIKLEANIRKIPGNPWILEKQVTYYEKK